jgi:hypothetical protein
MARATFLAWLAEIVHAARSRLSEARAADGLKAAELLTKICGYNEPEKHEYAHQHLHVDAGLIAQLREGHATLSARGAKRAPLLAEGAGGGTHPQREATPAREKGHTPLPRAGEALKIYIRQTHNTRD